ncbi:MAG: type II toxin-antitoxin system HicA family toxin [Ardenticatenaceae bacterium]
MTRIPRGISGRKCVKALERAGFVELRRRPHIIMHNYQTGATVSIPDHKELGPGILRAIIRDASLRPRDAPGVPHPSRIAHTVTMRCLRYAPCGPVSLRR